MRKHVMSSILVVSHEIFIIPMTHCDPIIALSFLVVIRSFFGEPIWKICLDSYEALSTAHPFLVQREPGVAHVPSIDF